MFHNNCDFPQTFHRIRSACPIATRTFRYGYRSSYSHRHCRHIEIEIDIRIGYRIALIILQHNNKIDGSIHLRTFKCFQGYCQSINHLGFS